MRLAVAANLTLKKKTFTPPYMDLTDRQRLIAKYVAVIDSLPVIAFLTNPVGKVSYLNTAWHRAMGVPKTHDEPYDRDLLTETPYDLLMHPDDEERVLAKWASFIESGSWDYRDELRIRSVDGTYRWFVVQRDTLRDDDGLFGWIGTLTDIDDIRSTMRSLAASEERYRILSQALPGSTWMAGPDGAFTHLIDGLSGIAGAPVDKLGADWSSVIHPDDHDRVTVNWAETVASGKALDTEARMLMTDGTYRWKLTRALPQRDRAGNILRWVGVTVDIDDRVRLEERIRRFVAEAGNELKAPLTVISGYIDLLSRDDARDDSLNKRMFEALSDETKRMRKLVEQLMTLARLDRKAGNGSEVIDVSAVTTEALAALAAPSSARISVDLPRGLLVLGEPSDCFEAVSSLLDNAINFSRETLVTIAASRELDSIVLRVRDGGPGVREAEIPRIFERFYRGSHALNTPGSGLGLAISTKAAERLGGRVYLEDARAGLTSFVMSIPVLEGL